MALTRRWPLRAARPGQIRAGERGREQPFQLDRAGLGVHQQARAARLEQDLPTAAARQQAAGSPGVQAGEEARTARLAWFYGHCPHPVGVRTAYRCRAYPDEAQQLLSRTFTCVRLAWNRTLAERHARYQAEGKSISPTPPAPSGTPAVSGSPAARNPYVAATESAARLTELTGSSRYDGAVVLGSGWAQAADALARALGADITEIPVADLGGFAPPSVPGHAGTVQVLTAGDLRLLVFLGRTHLYEGHPISASVHNVRTAMAAGCRVIALTNASGGIRETYRAGEPVIVRDHLNLTGRSPLYGPPPPAPYPSRFVDLTGLYSPRLRRLAREADPSLTEGVYAALPGPHYETPAEIVMLRTLGADLVGMSTVMEAIAARHLGAEVMAISLVTNLAAGLTGAPLSHAEVIEAGRASADRMGTLLASILPRALGGPPPPDRA